MTVWLIFLILSTLVMGFLLRGGGTVAGLPLGLTTAAGTACLVLLLRRQGVRRETGGEKAPPRRIDLFLMLLFVLVLYLTFRPALGGGRWGGGVDSTDFLFAVLFLVFAVTVWSARRGDGQNPKGKQ
ncbi:MAG: hypothetical protein IJC43_10905 [Clostridia bacterium]|nr:hypothetical protein [Clostridia bacterium]